MKFFASIRAKNLSHKSLAYQIIAFIFGFIIVIMLGSIILTRWLMSDVMQKNAAESMEYLANQNIFQLEAKLKKVQAHANDLASLIKTPGITLPVVEQFVFTIAKTNPEIESICLASNQDNYSTLPRASIYYVLQDKIKTIKIEGSDFLFKDWFLIPILNQSDYWSEPWYDIDGKKKTITSYSVPIKDKDNIVGVIRFDLSLPYLQNIVLPMRLREKGYAFLLSHDATIITHPADSLVMNETIFSLAQAYQDDQLRMVGREMVNGNSGFLKMDGSKQMKGKWIYYSPLISNQWSMGIVIYDKAVFQDLNNLLWIQMLIAILSFLILAYIVYARTLHIYKPLKALTNTASLIGAGNFDLEFPVSNSVNEIAMLEDALVSMKNSLRDYVQNLKQTTEEKNKIQAEVRFAADIQRKLIPQNIDPICNSSELRIFGVVEPASDVGGDLYDCFMLDDDHLCFAIADVLGKGLAAAMTMIMTSTVLRATAKTHKSITGLMSEINLFLCQHSHEANFVTMVLGVLNLKTGELEYSNAGHVPMYIRKVNRKVVKYGETHSTALGIFPYLVVNSDTIQLDLGDEIILVTDGITEAIRDGETFFGYQRLENILDDLSIQKPEHTANTILEAVRKFGGDSRQSDDITILVIDFIHPKRKR